MLRMRAFTRAVRRYDTVRPFQRRLAIAIGARTT